MILFVGTKEKGFFCEDVAGERKMEVRYVATDLHIENQAQDILRYKEQAKIIVYDIEQYADEPEVLVQWMIKIQDAIGIKSVIFAPGFSPQSTIIQLLYEKEIKNFIFSIYLGEQKEDLGLCMDGYFESFGYKEKRGFSFEIEEAESIESEAAEIKTKCIGVAGAITRIGTTTQAIQLVKYFQFAGYRAAYFQMNTRCFVENLIEAYDGVELDEDVGRATYMKVDMFYRLDKLQDVLKLDYDYLVFDYGVYSENGFNKISFLEKEIQIFVVGSKPGGEFESTYDVIKNNFYNSVYYIFSFVAESEQKDLLELMQEKADMTFFAEDAKDPFSYSGGQLYQKLFPVEDKKEQAEKKHLLFGRRKAR